MSTMTIKSHLLGDILVNMEIISRKQLEAALEHQQAYTEETMILPELKGPDLISMSRASKKRMPLLGQILVENGVITEDQLEPALRLQAKRAADLSRLDSRKLATALELGFIINATVSFIDVLNLIMKYANLVTNSEASTLMLLDETTGELVFSVPTGPSADDIRDIRIPEGAGIAGWVAKHEEYVAVNDTDNDPRFYSGVDAMTGQKTKSLLCVPMKSKRKLIGVLEVLNKRGNDRFTEEDAQLLTIFAHQAAISIENATLISSLKDKLQKEKQLMREFAESERLRAVGSLAGGIAHDFNNILGVIMGNAELALIDCSDPEIRKALNLIYEQTLRGKGLTRNLIAFAQTQDVKQDYFSISGSIDHVVDLMRQDLRDVELVRNFRNDVPEVLGDRGMIEHALVNLFQNALHAMSRKKYPKLIISTRYHESQICVDIEDNGCGIPEEHRESIYDPSFSLKGGKDLTGSYRSDIKGSGYGMANVKKYIEQHKGSIHFDTRTGQYTKFTICLPHIDKELTREERSAFQDKTVHSEKTILLVEDETSISDLQYRVLTGAPFFHTVHVAPSGAMAMDLFDRNEYDLISLDYVLPGGISGMEVYHHVRNKNAAMPVLFISGNIEFLESIKDLKKKDPTLAHLSKPCRHRDYLDVINGLLGAIPFD